MADESTTGGSSFLDKILNSGTTLFSNLTQADTAKANQSAAAKAAQAAALQAQNNSSMTTKLLIGGGIAALIVVVLIVVFKSRD